MPFQVWQRISPSTPVKDLYQTSVLACTEDPRSGVLLRCSTGLEQGNATIVHASASRPNALKMMGVDEDTQIVIQAQELLGGGQVHLVAIPHITWKSVGKGLRHRTLISIAITLLAAVLLTVPPLSLSHWVALPSATLLGVLTWLVLRERVPTRIGPPDSPDIGVDAVVKHVRLSLGGPSRLDSTNTLSREGGPRWAPHVR